MSASGVFAIWVKRPGWRDEAERDPDGFAAFVREKALEVWPDATGDVIVRTGALFGDNENEFCLTLATDRPRRPTK